MSTAADKAPAPEQGDRLLWLAAGVVAAIGLTWLVISKPWSSPEAPPMPQSSAPTTAAAGRSAASGPARVSAPDSPLHNPLRAAQLAFEAGMLVEPEDYSAWTLFRRVLAEDPENAAAKAGLQAVSVELLERAEVALEQGRFDDAEASVQRILGVLPEYSAALELAAEIERGEPEPAPAPTPAPEPEPVVTRAQAPEPPAAERPAAPPPVDPIIELDEAFALAMRENRLLTPAGDNAKHHLETMLEADAADERTRAAQRLLSGELLARSAQALEGLDPDAARSWIDAAEDIAPSPTAVAEARAELNARLIELESAKPLPASSFVVESYIAPDYPHRALDRGIEGWVDVEFTVGIDGAVRDILVAEASHERLFRNEAINAVSQWRFEPRIFMDQAIPQRSYTRIVFNIAE